MNKRSYLNKVSFIIPNYNGAALLAGFLNGLIENTAGASERIWVIDDGSTDASIEIVHKSFPSVNHIVQGSNGGFSTAVNTGIAASDGEFIVLLNNDVQVTPDFLDNLIPLFDDPTVFAVSPRIILPLHGDIDEGPKRGFWRHGLFYSDQHQGVDSVIPITYACGGAAIYRRSMLEQLGGFDELYCPAYWEDVDLGYRAWKMGWKNLYQSASTVYHLHSASTSKMNRSYIDMIRARNSLLFIWRNIDDAKLLRMHRRWLPFVLMRRSFARDYAFIKGWKEARMRIRDSNPPIGERVMSDSEIFNKVGVRIE